MTQGIDALRAGWERAEEIRTQFSGLHIRMDLCRDGLRIWMSVAHPHQEQETISVTRICGWKEMEFSKGGPIDCHLTEGLSHLRMVVEEMS